MKHGHQKLENYQSNDTTNIKTSRNIVPMKESAPPPAKLLDICHPCMW